MVNLENINNEDEKIADQTPLIGRVLQLKKLVDEGNYSDLPATLAKFRTLISAEIDPTIQNLIESAYHLCMALIHSQEKTKEQGLFNSGDGDPEDKLKSQLRSLFALLEKTAQRSELAVDQDEDQGSTPFLKSLLRILRPRLSKRALAPSDHAEPSASNDLMVGAQQEQQEEVTGSPHSDRDSSADQEGAVSEGSVTDYDMKVYFFGTFQVRVNGTFLVDWRNGKSKMIFKYLAANRECPVSKEFLMDLFWPNADADCARNNLNVSIYNIRQFLKHNDKNIHPIVYSDGRYGLNPDLVLWTDTEEIIGIFDAAERYGNAGDLEKQAHILQRTDELYKGDFLEEDRYEDWILTLRQKFKEINVKSLIRRADIYFSKSCYGPCIDTCKKLLSIDSCDEQVHGRLMICYSRIGQNHLAMRQYRCCVEALARELDITPSSTTADLYERIRRHASV